MKEKVQMYANANAVLKRNMSWNMERCQQIVLFKWNGLKERMCT